MSNVYLTVAEVAIRLKCNPRTVRRWIEDRKLRAVKIGNLVGIPERELSKISRTPKKSQRSKTAIQQFSKNAEDLVTVMRRLRRKINPADVEEMERALAESVFPSDRSNPLDSREKRKCAHRSNGPGV